MFVYAKDMAKSAANTSARPGFERLLHTAETLFARQGIEGTSLREIAVSAGNGNNNAVQYHFKSKDGLIRAIFDHRVAKMAPPRQKMLEKVERHSRLSDARTLLDILMLPILEFKTEDGLHSYAGFLFQYLTLYRGTGPHDQPRYVSEACPVLYRLLELIRARINYLPMELRESRMRRCQLMFIAAIVAYDNASPEERAQLSLPILIEDTLDIASLALCAPNRVSLLAERGTHSRR
jgi:AcrR family transcriptional regulator